MAHPISIKTFILQKGYWLRRIKKKNNGDFALRLFSSHSTASVQPPPPTQVIYAYNNPGVPVVSSTTTTTTTRTGGTGTNVNTTTPNGNGSIGINVNINGSSGMPNSSTTTTTTRRTTTTSSGYNNTTSAGGTISAVLRGNTIQLGDGRTLNITYTKLMFPYPELEMKQPMGANVTISYNGYSRFSSQVPFLYDKVKIDEYFKMDVAEVNGVTWSIKLKPKKGFKMIINGQGSVGGGGGGCFTAMSSGDFSSAKASVADEGFDETRLKIAKQIVSSNCMSASQITEMCETFGFEQTKLDFAKYAYDYCVDQNNYYKVNSVFGFSSSKEALSNYISKR